MILDYRSDAAKEYRKLYGRKAWKTRRALQIAEFPWCQWCERQGLTTAAAVVDHVIPHKGDLGLFLNGEVQSLCAPCHDAGKARQERGGYDSACDLEGYPLDPGHPANRISIRRLPLALEADKVPTCENRGKTGGG